MLEQPLVRYLFVFLLRVLVAMAAGYIVIKSPGFGYEGAFVFFLFAYAASKLHEVTPNPYGFWSILTYFLICFVPVYIIILGFSGGLFFDSLQSKTHGGFEIVRNGEITVDGHINFFVTVFAATFVYCAGFLATIRLKRRSAEKQNPQ